MWRMAISLIPAVLSIESREIFYALMIGKAIL
jgi:hypothetical protein